MEFIQQYYIVIIGIGFLCVLAAMSRLAWKDKQWVRQHYSKEDIIALGFGVTCFGVSSKPGAPERHKGFLLVHKDGLLFKGRFSGPVFDIQKESVQNVYHGNSHKGARLYQSAVKIDFSTPSGKTDTIAFKVAYPAQWIKIIQRMVGKTNPPQP